MLLSACIALQYNCPAPSQPKGTKEVSNTPLENSVLSIRGDVISSVIYTDWEQEQLGFVHRGCVGLERVSRFQKHCDMAGF